MTRCFVENGKGGEIEGDEKPFEKGKGPLDDFEGSHPINSVHKEGGE